MAEKRKLPARDRRLPSSKRRVGEPAASAKKKSPSTPTTTVPSTSAPPSPPPVPPEPIDDILPSKIADGEPLPILHKEQSTHLSDQEYQSIAESSVLIVSLERSKKRWLSDGIFDVYWTKPKKTKRELIEGKNPPKESMSKVGPCQIVIEPHHFDGMIYTVKDPNAKPHIQYAPPQRPMVHHTPPNSNFHQYQPPQSQNQMRQPSHYNYHLSPNAQQQHKYGQTGPAHSPPHHISQHPQQPQQRPVQPQQSPQPVKPTPDPVIQMLATRAAADPDLKALMKVVASNRASQQQLLAFQAHIDELNAIIRQQQQYQQRGIAAQPPVRRPSQQQQAPLQQPPHMGPTPGTSLQRPIPVTSQQPSTQPLNTEQSVPQQPKPAEPPVTESSQPSQDQPTSNSNPPEPPKPHSLPQNGLTEVKVESKDEAEAVSSSKTLDPAPPPAQIALATNDSANQTSATTTSTPAGSAPGNTSSGSVQQSETTPAISVAIQDTAPGLAPAPAPAPASAAADGDASTSTSGIQHSSENIDPAQRPPPPPSIPPPSVQAVQPQSQPSPPQPTYSPQQQPGPYYPNMPYPTQQGAKARMPPQYGAPPGGYYQQATPPRPPPSAKPPIKAVVFEFTSPLTIYGSSTSGHAGSGDRYLFPENTILEYVNGGTGLIASFLLVKKVDPNAKFPLESSADVLPKTKGRYNKSKKSKKAEEAEKGKEEDTGKDEKATPIPGIPTASATPMDDTAKAMESDLKDPTSSISITEPSDSQNCTDVSSKKKTQSSKNAESEGMGKDNSNVKEYYQPVTIHFYASKPSILEPFSRIVKPPAEVRKYMDNIMDRAERAPTGFLAYRLPTEDFLTKQQKEALLPGTRDDGEGAIVKEEAGVEYNTSDDDDRELREETEEEEELLEFYDSPGGLVPFGV